MNLARFAKMFGQARSGGPVRISASGLPVSQMDLEESFLPRVPPPLPMGGLPVQRMLDLEFVERTDVGRVRDHNEDYLGYASPATPAQVRTHGWLFVLADGVGGQEKGEVASKTAVECMVDGFHSSKDGESHSAVLQRLVQEANHRIFEAALNGGRASAGMATTIVAFRLRDDPGSGPPLGG